MRYRILGCLLAAALTLPGAVEAGLMGYTDRASFIAALPGAALTFDFDSLSPGDFIADGSMVGGITFNYDFGGVSMMVSNVYDTTSSPNFLGTDDADVFLDGDDFRMSFAPASAIGLSFITADTMFDNDILLTVGGNSVGLLESAIQATLGDGGNVYFLGLISDSASFTSATVSSYGGSGGPYFTFNVDDITTAEAVPEPGSVALFALLGSCAGLYGWRRKRQAVNRASAEHATA